MAIRFLLKHLPKAAFVVHAEGGLLDVNAGFSEIIGCKTDELVGRSLYDFMDEEMARRLKDFFSQHNLSKAIKYDITIFSTKSYSYTLELHLSNFNEQDDDSFLVLVNNVTHIKRVTKELREQRRLHKTLVQNMSGVVYRCKWDREYTMEHISSQCYEDTGYQPEDLIDNKRISFNSLIQGGV